MKRILSLLLSLSLLLALLPSCRPAAEPSPSEPAVSAQPSSTPTPTPAPTPTPEPVTGMEWLRDTLLDYFGEELAGLGGYSVTMFGDPEDFPRMVEETYGIAAELVTDGLVIDDADDTFFVVVVLRMPDGLDSATRSENCHMLFDNIHERQMEPYMEWNEESGYYVFTGGSDLHEKLYRGTGGSGDHGFIFYANSEKKSAAADVIDRAIRSMVSAEQSQAQAQPTPQPVEIADGVSFLDVSAPEAVGEPDPAHPGRAQYVQPNQEDMSVYDTSAIVTAWAEGDPDRLSAYDRAIYDSAKDVLEDILQDDMGDFSKEAAIYEWVIQSVEYDWSHTDVMEETPRESYTPYGGLVNRTAVCLGYAATFQLLAELAGIECVTVVGAANSSADDHAWNQVRLGGEWYCVDVTWDWPYREEGTMNGREWRYFNVTSDYMARTGHQWDYDNVPEATAEDHGRP